MEKLRESSIKISANVPPRDSARARTCSQTDDDTIGFLLESGVSAIPKGQFEASYAMGMSRFKTMVRIIFPQTLKIIVPSLTGQFVQTVKDSSILSIITVAEMTMMTKEAIGITFSPLIVYICAGVLYWALNLVIEFASRCIEKHNNRVAI